MSKHISCIDTNGAFNQPGLNVVVDGVEAKIETFLDLVSRQIRVERVVSTSASADHSTHSLGIHHTSARFPINRFLLFLLLTQM